MRRRALAAGLALLLVTAAGAGAWWWRSGDETRLARAMSFMPVDAERFAWTDWAAVRRALDASLSASSSAEDLEAFLAEGFDADLTSTSSLVESAGVLHEHFGWSPATVEWELLGQGTAGVALAVGLPESLSVDAVEDRLEELGFSPPGGEEEDVWVGGDELLATIAEGDPISPALQYVAFDEDAHVLLASDDSAYLSDVLQGETGVEGMAGDVAGVVEASGDAIGATVMTGDLACAELAMSQADPVDQAQADDLVAAAGEVHPLRGWAISVQPSRAVRVAMSFESEEQARTNADTRAALASGPAPGQGGDFPERFSVDEVAADGRVVTMSLRPTDGAYVMSDLGGGPVLFATC